MSSKTLTSPLCSATAVRRERDRRRLVQRRKDDATLESRQIRGRPGSRATRRQQPTSEQDRHRCSSNSYACVHPAPPSGLHAVDGVDRCPHACEHESSDHRANCAVGFETRGLGTATSSSSFVPSGWRAGSAARRAAKSCSPLSGSGACARSTLRKAHPAWGRDVQPASTAVIRMTSPRPTGAAGTSNCQRRRRTRCAHWQPATTTAVRTAPSIEPYSSAAVPSPGGSRVASAPTSQPHLPAAVSPASLPIIAKMTICCQDFVRWLSRTLWERDYGQ